MQIFFHFRKEIATKSIIIINQRLYNKKMDRITLQEITWQNLSAITRLSDTLTPEQKLSVATNVDSLAEAYVHYSQAWPRAIYLNDIPIGFVMIDLNNENCQKEDYPVYFLWRFMIARPYQNKGYGTEVLRQVVAKCKADGIKTLYTSCTMAYENPYRFYINFGFVDTLTQDEGEQVLKLYLANF